MEKRRNDEVDNPYSNWTHICNDLQQGCNFDWVKWVQAPSSFSDACSMKNQEYCQFSENKALENIQPYFLKKKKQIQREYLQFVATKFTSSMQ